MPQTPAEQIVTVIELQQAAWNAGDIDAFMDSYLKTDELTFSSGGQTTRGWQATIDRYKARYNSRELMGTLSFSDLEVTMLGDEAALVLGRWKLERDEPIGGNFSLVFRKIDGAWVIIHDHTSSSETAE
jgi:beta-aspartyl-peptidase (threonine type)